MHHLENFKENCVSLSLSLEIYMRLIQVVSVHQMEKCISRRTFEKTWFCTRKQKTREKTGLAQENKGTKAQENKGKNLVEHKMEDDGEEGGDDDRATDGAEEQL